MNNQTIFFSVSLTLSTFTHSPHACSIQGMTSSPTPASPTLHAVLTPSSLLCHLSSFFTQFREHVFNSFRGYPHHSCIYDS